MTPFWRIWFHFFKPVELTSWLGDGAKSVSLSEAGRRARLCLDCPNNVKDGVLVKTAAGIIRQRLGKKTFWDKHLGNCAGCGCDLKLKIWTPYVHIRQWQRQEVSDAIRKVQGDCWQL
jgi:hypothetical protein